jgi:signal transduction histidine kinase
MEGMPEEPVQSGGTIRQLIAFEALSLKALTAKNTDEILTFAVDSLEQAFHAALARIWLIQPDESLLLKASAGLSKRTVESSRYIIDPKHYHYKVGRVAETRVPYVSNHIDSDNEFDQDWIRKENLVAVAIYPLLDCNQLVGIVAIFSRQAFGASGQQAVAAFVAHITVAVEQTKLREEIQRQERLAMLGQLSGAVAHDLRAPLARITTALELLEEPLASSQEHSKYIEFISRATIDMSEIIGSLLDYARMVAIGRSICDLHMLLDEVLLEVTIPPNIKTSIELSEVDPYISVNHSQMKRTFINLIKNAVEAMQDGGVLTISASRQDDWIFINISDTGMGIETENLEKIFSPLFTKSVRGTGFGLAASRSIVEAHGGKLHVKSELGQGSTFTISLPQNDADQY